jgi:hypothetical protein
MNCAHADQICGLQGSKCGSINADVAVGLGAWGLCCGAPLPNGYTKLNRCSTTTLPCKYPLKSSHAISVVY